MVERNEAITSAIVTFITIGILIILILPPSSERTLIINQSVSGNGTVTSVNAGIGIAVNQTTGNVLVTNTAPDNTVCANLGSVGEGVYASGECNFKKLLAGTGTTLTSNGTRITIENSSPEATNCNNVGSGNNIHVVGSNCNARSLIAGTGVTITDTTDDYTFASQCANTGSGEAICESANNINSLIAGAGLTITDTTGDLTIAPKYELLCQNVLSGTATSFSCGAFTAREHIFIGVSPEITTSSLVMGIQFNGDTGTNYAWRKSANGGADTSGTNTNQCNPRGANSFANNEVGSMYLTIFDNFSDRRKIAIGQDSGDDALADTTPPSRTEFACKWNNESSQITTVTIMRVSGTGLYDDGAEIVIWGYD